MYVSYLQTVQLPHAGVGHKTKIIIGMLYVDIFCSIVLVPKTYSPIVPNFPDSIRKYSIICFS